MASMTVSEPAGRVVPSGTGTAMQPAAAERTLPECFCCHLVGVTEGPESGGLPWGLWEAGRSLLAPAEVCEVIQCTSLPGTEGV